MGSLTIRLDRSSLRPGDELCGDVEWKLDEAPVSGTLRVYWTTRGEQPTRSETVHEVSLEDLIRTSARQSGGPYRGVVGQSLLAEETRTFALRMPDSPYSFAGVWLGLQWRVAVEVEPSGELAEVDLTMSPSGAELDLYRAGWRSRR